MIKSRILIAHYSDHTIWPLQGGSLSTVPGPSNGMPCYRKQTGVPSLTSGDPISLGRGVLDRDSVCGVKQSFLATLLAYHALASRPLKPADHRRQPEVSPALATIHTFSYRRARVLSVMTHFTAGVLNVFGSYLCELMALKHPAG